MNYDEFAFFNQQLAAVLREGIPLEGAIKQLAAGMRSESLRVELQKLERDLAGGTPLKEALGRRHLPQFYRRMVEIGARSNDLPGVLILLADYYERANTLWTRLKGLMVYPLLVVGVSLGLTLLLCVVFGRMLSNLFDLFTIPAAVLSGMWIPPGLVALLALLAVTALSVPSWRARLRWRVPAFREASLSQLAGALALMLRKGIPLAEALLLAESLEAGTPAGQALARWRSLVEGGQGKPVQWRAQTAPFPPLFLWLVHQGREDPAAGFQKAAELYRARASYRIEMALYGALPISILFLGQMILWQVVPLAQAVAHLMNMLTTP